MYCDRCDYAEQLIDGSYYCTYHDTFKSEYFGCDEGIYGYPRLADWDTERRYEDWLDMQSYRTENNDTNTPSLLQIIRDWLSSKRSTSNDKKEEP